LSLVGTAIARYGGTSVASAPSRPRMPSSPRESRFFTVVPGRAPARSPRRCAWMLPPPVAWSGLRRCWWAERT